MATFIIDIWEDGELVQSIEGVWIEDEARRLTVYHLGYYRADRVELRREQIRDGKAVRADLVWEVESPVNAGVTILW